MTYDPNWPDSVPSDEEAASLSSLTLAPWVAAQAAAIREQHMEQRRGECDETTRTKVWRWAKGTTAPQGGRHRDGHR